MTNIRGSSFEQRAVPLDRLESETAALADFPTFHGSPVPYKKMGEFIEARQSLTKGYDGNMIPHGSAAISLSTGVHPFPKIRSLLHPNHPLLANREDINLRFAREVNYRNEPFYFVGAVTLLALIDGDGRGSVYGCEGKGDTEPFPGREDLGEHRALEALRWLLVAETSVGDLPDFLQVIDAPREQTWEFLNTLPQHDDPRNLAETLHVPLVHIGEWLN
jgi:hypothetical protein